jgi:hypothetical protein
LGFMAGFAGEWRTVAGVWPDGRAIGPAASALDTPLIQLDVQAAYPSVVKGPVHLRDPIWRP